MASDGEISCANDPNFAVIYSFLKVFGKLYGLEVPSLAKLQEYIENTQDVSEQLRELHLRLLRRALKSVLSSKWEKGLIKFCHQQGHHQEAWEIERFSYKKASTQVKLEVLKLLLEYQFTCHPKFKAAVNAISCKELRLNPIGRDKNGCVYWLEVDDDANLCLFKEDQDEETWQLVARNREELVKVIAQLKSGEEVCPLDTSNANEDSSGAEITPKKPENTAVEEDNEEEFFSPESESEHENDDKKNVISIKKETETEELFSNVDEEKDIKPSESIQHDPNNDQKSVVSYETDITEVRQDLSEITKNNNDSNENKENIESSNEIAETHKALKESIENNEKSNENVENHEELTITSENNEKTNVATEHDEGSNVTTESHEEPKMITKNHDKSKVTTENHEETKITTENHGESQINKENHEESKMTTENHEEPEMFSENNEKSNLTTENGEELNSDNSEETKELNDEVGVAIEEPVMVVTGEGSGADCESSYIIGEEITEEVMYFYGEGYGYDNDTGNPEVMEQTNSPEHHSDEENANEECVNGEHDVNSSNKSKLGKSVKLKSNTPTVTKRTLKKQSNDITEVLKSESKKHCIRDIEKSDSSNSVAKYSENELLRDAYVNDKITTDSESPVKNNIKKRRGKVKKKYGITKSLKVKEKEVTNSISETDNGHDSKTSIIEKRKSSVSSEHEEIPKSDSDKDKSPDKDLKVEDPLPPKKLRLESTPEIDVNETHSKANLTDSVEKEDNLEHPIAQRKKIKARKGKFKRKNLENSVNKTNKDNIKDSNKGACKSLKRSLIDATMSDKNRTESYSESEKDQPVASGKRLKIKPKKILKSSRKKVEAKLNQKLSSDESDDETLYSLAGKKTCKKLLKKKAKSKEKHKSEQDKKSRLSQVDDSSTQVRTSRRIALMKIKEQSQSKNTEENAAQDSVNKKKQVVDEEWRNSGVSSSECDRDGTPTIKHGRRRRKWRGSASSGPEPDSESDEPLFEMPHEEPDLNFDKSDHEFSPESDLESGEPAEPLKRARTLQEEQDEGFCKRCGSGEQPEWILLCDHCDAGYHASCLKPMLFLIPDGNWYCPQCNHDRLIESLEKELVQYDELYERVQAERELKKQELPIAEDNEEKEKVEEKPKDTSDTEDSGSSGWTSSSSSDAAVYRLRARKQLPVSYRAREYDRLISTAIKEEYVEPTTSAGNQGRGKDISTIIEAAEEEKLKAIEREAIEQGKPVDARKIKRKQRRKPRKLNSLDVPSEDDDETDEDFKDTGLESSSEEISSSAERDSSNGSRSSDSLPIRRTCRSDKKERPKLAESSPEVKKKKKGIFEDSSSESAGAKEWSAEKKLKKVKSHKKRDKRDKSKKKRRRHGLTQYDAEGNVIRARVTYGGLSPDEDINDWSPKHRTRQKKINYTEMPNTESEDEMHKSSGKHMPDSSDEFKVSDSELSSGSDGVRTRREQNDEEDEDAETIANRQKTISELIKKTAVVPLEKLPDDVARAKTEELHAHLSAQAALNARPLRGRGGRGGRGFRGGRGRRGRGASAGAVSSGEPTKTDGATDDTLAKLVGVKIKDLSGVPTPLRPNQAEREKKRLEREAKQAEKEARKVERLQKKEEKEKLKEQKAKEREEKKLAKIALQESKRLKKEKPEFQPSAPPYNMHRVNMYGNAPIPIGHPSDYQEQRFPATPRLQVRAELRRADAPPDALRDGTLSVAGSPQPFKPVSEEPSVITRMPHMINQQYRGPMVYGANNAPFVRRPPQNMMYPQHPLGARAQFPPAGYYPPPPYPPRPRSPVQHYRGQPPPAGLVRPQMGQFLQRAPGPMPGPPPGVTSPRSTPPAIPSAPPDSPVYRPQPSVGPPRLPMGGQFVQRGPVPLTVGPQVRLPAVIPPTVTTSSPIPPSVSSPPVRIKAEVKTEPEYRSPVSSPAPPSSPPAPHEPPRHPKIKHTENKDRRPRHPLGPYAPHYGPYGPYAPGPGPPPERPRMPFGAPPYHLQRPPYPQFPPENLRQMERPRSPALRPTAPTPERLSTGPPPESYGTYPPENLSTADRPLSPGQRPPVSASERPPAPETYLPSHVRTADRQPSPFEPRYPPETSNAGSFPVFTEGTNSVTGGSGVVSRGFTAHAVQRLLSEPTGVEPAPREESGVFGGLVSYFSSQHEDDMDA